MDDNPVERLGLGAMINILAGDYPVRRSSLEVYNASLGKTISSLKLDKNDEALHFKFTDGSGLKLWDDGQDCCELRYMTTDDDLEAFVGSELTGIELRNAPTTEDEYGQPHEIMFLLVNTSKGTFTMETYNEHNGYYGGFCINMKGE